MSVVSGLASLAAAPPRSARVTWGVFDGVHLGHRAVIEAVCAWARRDGARATVLTFDPHPQAFLRGVRIPLVQPVAERARLLEACGVDDVVVAAFDGAFAGRSPESFVQDVLLGALGAGGIVMGYDSTFGRGGKGTADLLRRLAGGCGVEVRCPAPRLVGGVPVKSTRLRTAIERGDLVEAGGLMGRSVELTGPVVHGDGRGRTLGFPTANVDCSGLVLPPSGVYAVRGRVSDARPPGPHREAGLRPPDGGPGTGDPGPAPLDPAPWDGVANIGRRPTFGGGASIGVEAHFLDVPPGDLYGRWLRIELVARLRDERRFDGPELLKRQMEADCDAARRALRVRP